MTTSTRPRVLLLWPYGIQGAESIPMCMSFLAPQLIAAGCQVSVFDCSLFNAHPNSERFAEAAQATRPDVIGISSWSQNWRWVQRTIGYLRDILPNVPIVLGGPHVTATNDTGKADYALTGEAEHTFPQLVTALAAGRPKAELEQIQGLRYFGQVMHQPQALIQARGLALLGAEPEQVEPHVFPVWAESGDQVGELLGFELAGPLAQFKRGAAGRTAQLEVEEIHAHKCSTIRPGIIFSRRLASRVR